MDIQASHPNTLHTNLSLGGGDSATSQHKNMYDTNTYITHATSVCNYEVILYLLIMYMWKG